MSDEISGISGKSMVNRLTAKKQASMEEICAVKDVKPTQQMQSLEKMREQMDYALQLTSEIRGKVEAALSRLNSDTL